ncbi:adenosine deaminase [Pseudomaricurvus alkylphenolicus]|uniref:adenosine deaminase n=1 Tax=Pseudomaricurvus alkylphenolicus TaxID=1306991 RepID=UPI00141E0C8A|nr:adenosine deaminase [Pseudomaricurvus alkylphenolicus]NIB43645.1 adenosine deaminase [Pseudomaricurvus alkylphenolicus]
MKNFIANLPKAELHLHIEGTLEPELMFALAKRNHIELPYASVEEVRAAYRFSDLQSFLDIYYQGAQVLIEEQDFYDLTWAYLEKLAYQEVRHLELFFDPQTHTDRGVAFSTVIKGIHSALVEGGKRFGVSSKLIMCFLRHLDEDSALDTLEHAKPYRQWIEGVGLDSGEAGNPPEKFQRVFDLAREQGYRCVAHAGEEGPADYIWQALKLLHAERIDHGVRCDEDPALVDHLREQQIPLTVCPLSNTALKVYQTMSEHNIGRLLREGLLVTVNSDDPAYFGGQLNDNYEAIQAALDLSVGEIVQLARNGFEASFLSAEEKQSYLDALDEYVLTHPVAG